MALEGDIFPDELEAHLAKYYRLTGEVAGGPPLLIDFAEASYIDVAVLANCVATIVDRLERRVETLIGLPNSQQVLDFMRVWRFPEAVQQATRNEAFDQFVLSSDRIRLSAPQLSYRGIGSGLDALQFDPDWTPARDRRRNFFEFLTVTGLDHEPIGPDRFDELPRDVGRSWTSVLLKEVLREHFSRHPLDEIARVLVYEAIANAVRHPNATTIQVVAKLETSSANATELTSDRAHVPGRASESKVPSALRICIWDDGTPIAETLASATVGHKLRHAYRLPSYMCMKVRVTRRDWHETLIEPQRTVDECADVEPDTEDRLLMASLFPGISREISHAVEDVAPFSDAEAKRSVGPGMGLYALRRIALDQFQGDLLIRSGHLRLFTQVAHDAWREQYGVQYKAKITEYPQEFPPFRGNLLVINLPVPASATS